MCLYANFKDKIEWVKFTFAEKREYNSSLSNHRSFKVCRRLIKTLKKNMNEVNKCKLLLELEVQGILE